MTRDEILEDLKYFSFRNRPSTLLTELEEKVKKAEQDNIDVAVYTTMFNKVKVIYDSGKYYMDFLMDNFMDVDYSLEATEGFLEYSVEEVLTVLKAEEILKKA